MPEHGPGAKNVLKGLKHALPDQGPGTKLVLKGLKLALPRIAERNERDARERKLVSLMGDGEKRQEPSVHPSTDHWRSHKHSKDNIRSLVAHQEVGSNRRSHREDMHPEEEADRQQASEEKIAPRKHTAQKQDRSSGMKRDEPSRRRSTEEENTAQLQRDDRTRERKEEVTERCTNTDQASSRGSAGHSRQPHWSQDGFRHQNRATGAPSGIASRSTSSAKRATGS